MTCQAITVFCRIASADVIAKAAVHGWDLVCRLNMQSKPLSHEQIKILPAVPINQLSAVLTLCSMFGI